MTNPSIIMGDADELEFRQPSGRKMDPTIKGAIDHLMGLDPDELGKGKAVMVPCGVSGVTPDQHRNRVAASIAGAKRRGLFGSARVRVRRTATGEVWIVRES